MNDDKKAFKVGVLALVIALLAFTSGGISGTIDNSKLNKTGDNISGNLKDLNIDWSIFPLLKINNSGVTGGYNSIDILNAAGSPLNTTYKFFDNNIIFEKPCPGDDGYGGAVGYCWMWGKYNNRDGMTFQIENGDFTYYFWKAGLTNTNTYGVDDESAGYTRRMRFDKNLTIYNGTLISNKLSGTGNAYACLDSNGKLFRSGTPCV